MPLTLEEAMRTRNVSYSKIKRSSNSGKYTTGFGCFLIILIIILLACVGPMCLAYDINTLDTYFHGELREVSMWEVPVFICGIAFSTVLVPLTLLLWLAASIGLM